MPRPQRYKIKNVPQLVMQLSHNRLPCFYDGQDYQLFQQWLHDITLRYNCTLDAYALLPDRIFLLLSSSDENGISKTLQTLGRKYTQYINQRYRRFGTLWSGRYYACLAEPNEPYLSECRHFVVDAALRCSLILPENKWPWQSKNVFTSPQLPAQSLAIEQTLRAGLVWSSQEFKDDITAKFGVKTMPASKGRPIQQTCSN